MLQEKVDGIMTDAAAKNLQVEKSLYIYSSYTLYYFLYKIHTCKS